MPFMFILQGAQGSGKSEFARQLRSLFWASKEGCVIASTDYEFTELGVYTFDPTKLAANHAKTQAKTKKYAESGFHIVVDNCNSQCWEAKPYVQIANEYGYTILFHRCEGRYENIHGVPADRVQMIRDRMEVLTVEACLAAKAPWEK